MTIHQRVGSRSSFHAGREFEALANAYYLGMESWKLKENFAVPVGVSSRTKLHRFDFGCDDPPALIECKSHHFTTTGGVPNAKLVVWNEAMYYCHLAPPHYRKVFFVLDARHARKPDSLAASYVRNYGHLIPADVRSSSTT